jgi:glycosyltransferase involved in cell wall biosynthesis
MHLTIVGQHYDTSYLDFLRTCAEGKDVVFDDTLEDEAVRALLHRAGTVVHASTHVDYTGRYAHKPELLGLAPLEALASGAPTLVSDAACLPELAVLPGCRVFHDEAELAAMLLEHAAGRPPPDAAEMHAEVDRRYGPGVVGAGLLAMMGVAAPCAS